MELAAAVYFWHVALRCVYEVVDIAHDTLLLYLS